MHSSALALALSIALAASVHAQSPAQLPPGVTGTFPAVPLASKHFTYPSGIPEKVDTDTGLIRGTQLGFNICNKTTENPESLCQTSFLNGLDDFCLWAPSKPNSTVADEEGEMVAWCTKPGHGTRLIPAGALQGVQYMRTPDYAQVVGFIDQSLIDLNPSDFGGEMDPHGADLRGNPMGGIVFSTAFTGQYEQVIEWHNFMGGGAFCFKVCDPSGANAANYCQHIYDRIGCAYNAPNNAQNGTFEACDGADQDFPGVYTINGTAVTYTQPPESLGPITTIPYTPRVPASSNCVTHASTDLYVGLPAPTSIASGSSSVIASAGSSVVAASASPSIIVSTGSSGVVTTSTRSAASPSNTSGARSLAIPGISIFGVVFASIFFS